MKIRINNLPFSHLIPVHELKVWKKGEQKPVDAEKIASLSAEQLAQVKRNAKYRWGEQFTWIVIDRADNQARVLTLPVSFYRKVKELDKYDY